MTSPGQPAADRDERWERVLVEVLDALDRGEGADPAAWQARYPEFREELTRFLDGQTRVERVARPLRAAVESVRATPHGGGRTLGDFRILREVGRGGMGIVYEAEQLSLGRRVALKVLPFAVTMAPNRIQRFRNEAETAARLDHAHIVPIYEVGQHQGMHYLAMKLVEGGTLAQKLAGTPFPPRRAAELVGQLARAIAHAHQRGIIHRDLKPSNVLLLSDGTPQIADFGLAKRLEEPGITLGSVILGTPSYMAPEQALRRGGEVGPLVDVYALGSILYELLTGRPPFRGATVLDTLDQVRSLEPVPPTRLQPRVPRDLEAICLKCLEKEPGRRYASANALAEDLDSFLGGRPTQARPAGLPARAWLWCRRTERIRDAGAFMIFMGLVLTAWCVWSLTLCTVGVLSYAASGFFVPWLLFCIGAIYLPMVWLGRKMIQRRQTALWAGLFLTSLFLIMMVAAQFQSSTPVDGVYQRGAPTRMAGEALLIILASIQVFACATAVMAYRANRHAIRWSESDGTGEGGS